MDLVKLVSAGEMAAIDLRSIEEGGIPATELMERAGRGVYEIIQEEWDGLDGLDLARIVSTTYPSVAVVLISGNDGYGYETAAIEEGAKAFLSKADLSAEALSRVI